LCHFGNEIAVDDIRYVGSISREAQWAVGIGLQAVSRNTHSLRNSIITELSGPGTDTLLYEITVGMMNICVSGSCLTTAPRSAGGKYTDYLTPLEVKLCGEVYKACAGMTRAQANEIAKVLIPKYEGYLANPPKGKSVRECYDLKKSKPTQEWLDIYLKVKRELIELGIPLNPDN